MGEQPLRAGPPFPLLLKSIRMSKGKQTVMKIGVSLYSFHAYAGEDSLGMKGCIAKAKEIAAKALTLLKHSTNLRRRTLRMRVKLARIACEIGVEAVCFCVGSDFLNGSGGDVDAEIARVKGRVDIAAAYGCKLMRHDATPDIRMIKSSAAVSTRCCRSSQRHIVK